MKTTKIENQTIEEVMLKYKYALDMLETQLKILITEYEYQKKYNIVEHMKSRIKAKESSLKKLERKGYEYNAYNLVHHVHDMIGVRIVCSFKSDVYEIVNMIRDSKQIIIKEEEDYIKAPKETGYTSYHINVLVPVYLNETTEYIEAEIQIRTVAMDFWASLDHKIQYKFSGVIPKEITDELYRCSLAIEALDDKMLNLNDKVKTSQNGGNFE